MEDRYPFRSLLDGETFARVHPGSKYPMVTAVVITPDRLTVCKLVRVNADGSQTFRSPSGITFQTVHRADRLRRVIVTGGTVSAESTWFKYDR